MRNKLVAAFVLLTGLANGQSVPNNELRLYNDGGRWKDGVYQCTEERVGNSEGNSQHAIFILLDEQKITVELSQSGSPRDSFWAGEFHPKTPENTNDCCYWQSTSSTFSVKSFNTDRPARLFLTRNGWSNDMKTLFPLSYLLNVFAVDQNTGNTVKLIIDGGCKYLGNEKR